MNDATQSVQELFGSNVFNDSVMRERLPKSVYRSLRKTIEGSAPLEPSVADVVATVMKGWAIEKGATHFCHWFQPLTGLTAEKHDAFISPAPDGTAIVEFSGKELTKGEPDASSFPSGGLRATFEARGYTAWDCTSPVFVKRQGDNTTLYIPCAFASYTGEALDKKTPLLRSMDALNTHALRVLRALGNTTATRVIGTLGPEQEYFLINTEHFEKRLDLVLTGRTLFGAPPARGQEMEDHYFGILHERVASCMAEVNTELWRLGVASKTQHNEVAPSQYELAPMFVTVNVAADHNQLVMEVLQRVALHHGFVCLLHEKPFAGVNGSGKHLNWSMCTDTGINLLEPGNTPHDNLVFLVFLSAIICAVDRYSSVLRAMVATSGNEHRLGANEAPPAIVSMFLGTELTGIINSFAEGLAPSSSRGDTLHFGVPSLPPLPKDSTDRNRTSPFAFTGNKFEFRMVGSSQSPSSPVTALQTIVAMILSEFADNLERPGDLRKKALELISKIAREHRRVIFDGDNYTAEWVQEAARRGLPNIANSVQAIAALGNPENVALFECMGVMKSSESHARMEINLETYTKVLNIEALTTLSMIRRQVLPAVVRYAGTVAEVVKNVGAAGLEPVPQRSMLAQVQELLANLQMVTDELERALGKAQAIAGTMEKATAYHTTVRPAGNAARRVVDQLEGVVDAEVWPMPTYADMLFLT